MSKPFMKWAGGKYKLIDSILVNFPKTKTRYIEPFAGAASVALNVENYDKIIINDYNKDVYLVWLKLKEYGNQFIRGVKSMFRRYEYSRENYGKLKDEFNKCSDNYRRALLFVWLNRHCFNGLCRYNSKGNFNVPVGDVTKSVYFPSDELNAAAEKAKKWKIYNYDFREIFEMVQAGDHVYCDPPYVPLSDTANFNDYAMNGFTLKDQLDLAKCASIASEKGAHVVLSNHYTWFTKELYSGIYNAKIKSLEATRVISSKGCSRKPVKEILAIFQSKNAAQEK